jgi:LacI family transcriptional regulator
MLLSVSDFSAKKEAEIINYLSTSKSADGIIVIAGKSNIKFNKDMPIVALHTDRNNSEVDCINISFIDAINEAIKYLKDLGHKKIGFIGESLTKSKQENFEKALQSNGLSVNPNWIFNQKERFEQAGKTAMEQVLLLEDKPSAIMCAYDNIALGAIEIIKKHGKSVPHDFSLIGFDDIPIASHVSVGLTTIKSNNDAICDLAVDLILKKIDSKFYALHQQITLHAELIVRSSVSKLN